MGGTVCGSCLREKRQGQGRGENATLESELAVLKFENEYMIEEEAACCPEDVGFVEYIRVLTTRAETAEAHVGRLEASLKSYIEGHQCALMRAEAAEECVACGMNTFDKAPIEWTLKEYIALLPLRHGALEEFKALQGEIAALKGVHQKDFHHSPYSTPEHERAITRAEELTIEIFKLGEKMDRLDVHLEHERNETDRLSLELKNTWRCFICDYVATNEEEAKAHFGDDPHKPPTCDDPGDPP